MSARAAGRIEPSVIEVLLQRVAGKQAGGDGKAEDRGTAKSFKGT